MSLSTKEIINLVEAACKAVAKVKSNQEISSLEGKLIVLEDGEEADNLKNEIADKKSKLETTEKDLQQSPNQQSTDQESTEESAGQSTSPDSNFQENFIKEFRASLDKAGIPYSMSSRGGVVTISFTTYGDHNKGLGDIKKRFGKEASDIFGKLFDAAKEGLIKFGAHNANKDKEDNLEKSNSSASLEMKKAILESAGILNSLKSATADKEWYGDEKVMEAAINGVNNKDKIEGCGAIPIGGQLDPEELSHLLKDRIESARVAANEGKTCLMPFQIDDNHWVGGVMAKDGQGNMLFIHNDPLGNEIHESLKTEMENQRVNVIDLQKSQQTDNYNCGAHTADNLSNIANRIGEAQSKGLDMRESKESLSEGLSKKNGDELRQDQKTKSIETESTKTKSAKTESTKTESKGR
jgi:hypothetical protein